MKKRTLALSFGADSTALLLLAIYEGLTKIDKARYTYSGALSEPKCLKDHKQKIIALLRENHIEYEEIKQNDIKKVILEQNEFCGIQSRTATYKKVEQERKDEITIIGITVDEHHRKCNKQDGYESEYPLIDKGITHEECIKICYKYGYYFDYEGIRHYDYLSRTACPICSYQRPEEILFRFITEPEIIEEIRQLEKQIKKPFKPDKYVYDIIQEELKKYYGMTNEEILVCIKERKQNK